MNKRLSRYQEGDCLVIRDPAAATRNLSMQEDFEEDMAVEVTHKFDTFLVCQPTDRADADGAYDFPPKTVDQTGSSHSGSEQRNCG